MTVTPAAPDVAPGTPPAAPTWTDLITTVLARRSRSQFTGYTAAVRSAAMLATERFAYAHTEPFLSGLTRQQRIGARRAAGICAANPGAHQPGADDSGARPYRPLGSSLRDLYRADTGTVPTTLDSGGVVTNALLMQINALPMLDVEQAANTLGLLVKRCADRGITVDYYDLARTLVRWGNGISGSSQAARAAVLTAFYTH